MTMNRTALLAGVGIGAGLMYFFDPARGRRRRAAVRDRAVHSAIVSRKAAGATARDLMNRTRGTAAEVARAVRRQPKEETLVERVRSRIGRLVSHPHAITVEGDHGVICLGGPILQAEVPRLLREVERVAGVREVVNQLQEHKEASGVPGLQGGRSPMVPRLDVRQPEWAPATRVIAGAAGSAIAAYGTSRRDLTGVLLTAGGVGLILRAVTSLQRRGDADLARAQTLIGTGRPPHDAGQPTAWTAEP